MKRINNLTLKVAITLMVLTLCGAIGFFVYETLYVLGITN